MKKTFVQITRQYFDYLIHKYSFDLLASIESPRGHPWEGRVEYATKLTYVDIDSARGESPVIQIGRLKDGKDHPVSLSLLYEYFNLTEGEKDIILSQTLDKELRREVSEILYKRHIYRFPASDDPAEKMDLELSANAEHLLQYAEPFLRGDFSIWLEIYEYKVGKLRAEFIRSGKDEFVLYRRGLDEMGKPIYEKRSLFQDSMNYLDNLKAEYRRG